MTRRIVQPAPDRWRVVLARRSCAQSLGLGDGTRQLRDPQIEMDLLRDVALRPGRRAR